jgi:hypothetical protein
MAIVGWIVTTALSAVVVLLLVGWLLGLLSW